uniref:J domain-containing protein n=1 Tax=Globisporangium ultimum (strain ATCC 200006 / CBS 805.95 / DAOM BR144) TaxID=431595 RepID=K3X6R5_GLOUD
MAKHVAVAYVLWLVGFWMGLPHLYLRRPRAAFLHAVTLNGGGVGWWRDLLLLPTFVREANADAEFVARQQITQRFHAQPRVAWLVLLLQFAIAQGFGTIAASLVPKGAPAWSYEVLFLLGASNAIVFSGEALELSVKSSWRSVVAVMGVVLMPMYIYTEGDVDDLTYKNTKTLAIGLGCGMFWVARQWSETYKAFTDPREHAEGSCSSTATSKQAAPEKQNQPSWWRTLLIYYGLLGGFTLAAGTAMLFHGHVTVLDAQGREQAFSVYEVAANVFHARAALFDGLGDLFSGIFVTHDASTSFQREFSWFQSQQWKQKEDGDFDSKWRAFQSRLDVTGRQRYLKVLGLGPEATQAEIKRAYKQLALQWHPDKYAKSNQDEDAQAHAQLMFYRIQEAYEKLQKLQPSPESSDRWNEEL